MRRIHYQVVPPMRTQPLGSGDDKIQWVPPMNVYETKAKYVVRLEIPGVRKQDLRLGFRDNTLTICGQRAEEMPAGSLSYLHMEIEHGEFRREIRFAHDIQREVVQAQYQEGFLKVVLPKK